MLSQNSSNTAAALPSAPSSMPSPVLTLTMAQVERLQEALRVATAVAEMDFGDLTDPSVREAVLRRLAGACRSLVEADVAALFGPPPRITASTTVTPPLLAATDYDTDSPFLRDAVLPAPAEAAVRAAATHRRPQSVEDIAAPASSSSSAAGLDYASPETASLPLRSVLTAPLSPAPNLPVLGVLAAYMVEPRVWTEADRMLLSTFAAAAAGAMSNLRLRADLEVRTAEMRALYEIAHLLGSSQERLPLLYAVIRRLTVGVGAKSGSVLLVERGELGEAELKIRASHGVSADYIARVNAPGGLPLDTHNPRSSGPAAISVRERRPCAIGDVMNDAAFAPFRPLAVDGGYRAILTVPLCAQEHVHGSIALYFAGRRDFTQAELNFTSAVADALALALERMGLSERLLEEAVANRTREATDKMKAEFISTVSHELRTPLTIIKGYSDLLASGQAGELSETQKNFVNGVQRNTSRLAELVSDLLDISQMEAGRFGMARRVVDLGRVVAESCTEYERVAAQRGIPLQYVVEEALPPVEGDARRLGQVVSNLISNAVKYSPPGQTVYVSCERANRDADARDDAVVVRVRDQGPGIPPEAQGRLFEKFYRVDSSMTRQVGGTGLGLAIAKSIVEQHGGRIWLERSVPGEGSTFAFVLPAAPVEAKEATGIAAAAAVSADQSSDTVRSAA